MSDDTKRVIFWVLGIALFMVFYLIIMAVVGFVKGAGGVESMLDYTGYVVIAALIVGILFAIILLVARIFNMATRNIIEFQAADDKGEAFRIAMKGITSQDKQVGDMVVKLVGQTTKIIDKEKYRQSPAPKEVEPEYADYWPLPQLEDEQHELAR